MNAEAIQDFLFRHVEKFVFGALTLLALFLIYQGVNTPDISATQQPEKMEQSANQVKVSIEDDHWAAIKEPRLPKFDIIVRAEEEKKPVPVPPYKLPNTFPIVDGDGASLKRTDPKLPVPIDLQVTGVVASLAMKSTGDYPIGLLERADAVKKDEKKIPPKPAKKNRMDPSMMMSDSSMMSEEMMMMGDPSRMSSSSACRARFAGSSVAGSRSRSRRD